MNKFFGTDGIRGKVGVPPITEEMFGKLAFAIGSAFAQSTHSKNTILIARDTRSSGEDLEKALVGGLLTVGVDCFLLGIIPTPVIGFLTRNLNATAGIIISASHNPPDENGLKIFSSSGSKLSDQLEQSIEEILQNSTSAKRVEVPGSLQRMNNGEDIYFEFCKNSFPAVFNQKRLKIILDCANGATYRLGPKIFRECCNELLEIGVTPNGYNINENCGSTHIETLKSKVIKEKADMGIAFDGDGDRIIMVDDRGEIIDGDELLYIIAKFYHGTHKLLGGVVGTLMSNIGLENALRDLGIEFCRSKVGDHFIYEMLKEKNWNLGGEPSGHIQCLNKTTTGDGIISALQILEISLITQKSLYELKQGINKYPQVMINVPYTSNMDILAHPKIVQAINQIEDKFQGGRGRIIVRYSGTEPLLRVMLEGKDLKQVQDLANGLVELIKKELQQESKM